MQYILTENSLTVIRGGRPATLHRGETGEETWTDAMQAVHDGNFDAIERLLDKGTQVNAYFEGHGLEVRDGVLYFGNNVLDNYPARKAVQFWREGLPHEALINFLHKLLGNPSYRAVQDLYSFLEFNRMPLTEDGHFLAYKKVRLARENLTPGNDSWTTGSRRLVDIHSGQFDNSVGAVCEMPRYQVDEDPNRTCSAGLHVCSYDYLPHFGWGGYDTVVAVKVNPAHVVAIPVDYNQAKMRVSRYEVVDDLPDYRETGHIWSDTPVVSVYDHDEPELEEECDDCGALIDFCDCENEDEAAPESTPFSQRRRFFDSIWPR